MLKKKQLLTLEQSIQIRKELKQKELDYEETLQRREKRIDELNLIVIELEKNISEKNVKTEDSINDINNKVASKSAYEKLKLNKTAFEYFEQSYKSIEKGDYFPNDVPEMIREYFVVNGIFDRNKVASGNVYYSKTSKGINIYREYFNEKYG